MKKIFKKYLVLFSLLMIYSCEEENTHKPYALDDTVPAQALNVKVKNISGGAILTYDLPKDPNILSVKAVYTSTTGVERSSTVSAFAGSLVINGFGNTDEYDVKLYSVSYSNVYSEPFNVKIKPLTPPIELVFNTLRYSVGFGGFIVDFENDEKSEVAIYLLQRDSATGEMVYYDALYTKMEKGQYSVKGLTNKENDFGICVRDRFDNTSDTLLFTETPWREDYLDKKQMSVISVLGDNTWANWGGQNEHLFDDIHGQWNYVSTIMPAVFPHLLTVDLRVDVKLSRFKLWQRMASVIIYQHGSPKYFKVYGRLKLPESVSIEDPLNGWTLLSECRSIKPSELPVGQYSAEDWEYAAKGEEYILATGEEYIPTVRYIRFEMLESWSGMETSCFGELSFWGEIQ